MIELSHDAYDEARVLLDRRLIVTVNSNEEVIEAIQDILLFARAQKISLNAAGELVQGDVDNWLPIETAPRDGAEVILLDRYGTVGAGFYSEEGGYKSDVGFFFEGDRGNILIARNADPTHWMPLPEAPK